MRKNPILWSVLLASVSFVFIFSCLVVITRADWAAWVVVASALASAGSGITLAVIICKRLQRSQREWTRRIGEITSITQTESGLTVRARFDTPEETP